MLAQTRLARLFAVKQLAASRQMCSFSTTASELATQDKKYQELCVKFEQEWTRAQRDTEEQQLQTLKAELTPAQMKRVDSIVDAYLSLNIMESRFLNHVIKEQLIKTKGLSPMTVNIDWPSIKQLENGTYPPVNPNWALQQEVIQKLWPSGQAGLSNLFSGMARGGSGVSGRSGAPAATAAATAAPEEKPAEEAPKEKLNYDLELVAIDATQKIKIIKEVRSLLNLGLKEAKDMVEKTPCVLKSNVKKSEAEELKEKLLAIGCTINLL